MTESMTFNSLKEDVAIYVERGTSSADTDVFDKLPRLINLAERRISRDIKVQGTQEVVTTNFVAGQAVYDKPDRWRATVSMNFGGGADLDSRTPVFGRSYEYCRNYWPDDSETSVPAFYADYDDDHWLVVPTPDQGYPVEIIYTQMVRPLSVENQTNWITSKAPQLLLYATLCEMHLFLKAFDTLAVWEGKYKEALAALNGVEVQKMVDRSATRQGV